MTMEDARLSTEIWSEPSQGLLVIEAGSTRTRAILFDVVENQYRLVGIGSAIMTADVHFENLRLAAIHAINQLELFSARKLLDSKGKIIHPSQEDGSGIDSIGLLISAAPPLKIIAIGLLGDVSLNSARRLAQSIPCGDLESFSLAGLRKPEVLVDAVINFRPDLIILAGGTDNGAVRPIRSFFETIDVAVNLLPEDDRPEIVYAGNNQLKDELIKRYQDSLPLTIAPNIRPTLEEEDLNPAASILAQMTNEIRYRKIYRLSELHNWATGPNLPTSSAFSRIIQFLSKARTPDKGVMGLRLGISSIDIVMAFHGQTHRGVYPEYGLGADLSNLLESHHINEIIRWLIKDIPVDYLQAYILNKHLHPFSIPVTQDELVIEQALARHLIRLALRKSSLRAASEDHLPAVEPIIASGRAITNLPTLAHSLLLLLDSLQPVGATTIVLDPHQITAALGLAAEVNPLLAVQVLDSNAFLHLGTIISPVGKAPHGTKILQITMTTESGYQTHLDVTQGALDYLPLPPGNSAQLQLTPFHRYDVGMGAPGRSGVLRVKGGLFGVVFDARGRPLSLPDDAQERHALYQKWLWSFKN